MDHIAVDREPQRLVFMKRIHAGIVAFAEDFIARAGSAFDDLPLGTYLGSKVFFQLARQPSAGDARLFAGLKVENSFGGGDTWLLYDERELSVLRGTGRPPSSPVRMSNSPQGRGKLDGPPATRYDHAHWWRV